MSVFARLMEERRSARVRDLLRQRSEAEESALQMVLAIVNSPFFITLLSGLLIAGITNGWQEYATRQDNMQKTMVVFADQISKTLNLLPIRKKWELEIRALRANQKVESARTVPAVNGIAVDMAKAEARYDAVTAKLDALSDTSAVTSQARAAFGSQAVIDYCDRLDDLIDRIGQTGDLATALTAHAEALQVYKAAMREMGREIRRE
jgi:hypothetical protein